MRVPLDGSPADTLIGFTHDAISRPVERDGRIVFGSPRSGLDNLYALDLAKKGFADAVAAERARGNTLTYASEEWGGFPIRIGVDLTGVTWKAGALSFEAGKMRLEAMPWRPSHVLVRAEGAARLAWNDDETRESAVFRPGLLIAGGLQGDAPLHIRQGLAGVQEQVDHHLFDPLGIALDGRQV